MRRWTEVLSCSIVAISLILTVSCARDDKNTSSHAEDRAQIENLQTSSSIIPCLDQQASSRMKCYRKGIVLSKWNSNLLLIYLAVTLTCF